MPQRRKHSAGTELYIELEGARGKDSREEMREIVWKILEVIYPLLERICWGHLEAARQLEHQALNPIFENPSFYEDGEEKQLPAEIWGLLNEIWIHIADKLLSKKDHYNPEKAGFETWVSTVARHKAYSLLRSLNRSLEREEKYMEKWVSESEDDLHDQYYIADLKRRYLHEELTEQELLHYSKYLDLVTMQKVRE